MGAMIVGDVERALDPIDGERQVAGLDPDHGSFLDILRGTKVDAISLAHPPALN